MRTSVLCGRQNALLALWIIPRKRKLFITILIIIFMGYQGLRSRSESRSVIKNTDQYKHVPQPGKCGMAKVLVVGYMRGGTSVLGELFNQNPDALYWFEPLAGLYSALYGTQRNWRPLTILTRQNGQMRDLKSTESEAIVSLLRAIYCCDVGNIPLDVMTEYNLLTLVQQKMIPYAECVRYRVAPSGGLQQKLHDGANMAAEPFSRMMSYQCKDLLSKICSYWNSPEELQTCHREIYKHKMSFMDNTSEPKATHYTKDLPQTGGNYDIFKNYFQCMLTAYKDIKECVPILTRECERASMVAAKVIRMDLSILADVIQVIPDLRIISYHRDPRAIVWSRYKAWILSSHAKRDIFIEAKLLCERMLINVKKYISLKSRYPSNIITFRYEDLVQDPQKGLMEIYNFIDVPIPVEVSRWTKMNFYGDVDNGNYGTSRRNASATAIKWKNEIPREDQTKLTSICREVLTALHYDVS